MRTQHTCTHTPPHTQTHTRTRTNTHRHTHAYKHAHTHIRTRPLAYFHKHTKSQKTGRSTQPCVYLSFNVTLIREKMN